MCDFQVLFADIEARFGAAATPYIEEAKRVAARDDVGICEADRDGLRMTEAGRPFVRVIASRFDAYLDKGGFRFSKAV